MNKEFFDDLTKEQLQMFFESNRIAPLRDVTRSFHDAEESGKLQWEEKCGFRTCVLGSNMMIEENGNRWYMRVNDERLLALEALDKKNKEAQEEQPSS